ncbi:hypothetical protein FA15DRAFT_86578 [Coprinopsis marcescibilis]|uniref:Uncharacterized protein n=1 Tax=Coprinopsis marcescibilis TaxID=230819 RepID=A0A5C3L5M5_COPMA|nr:hypothetical protein FA15DRAFT_86578 [Coprinopsis marcescibilis]
MYPFTAVDEVKGNLDDRGQCTAAQGSLDSCLWGLQMDICRRTLNSYRNLHYTNNMPGRLSSMISNWVPCTITVCPPRVVNLHQDPSLTPTHTRISMDAITLLPSNQLDPQELAARLARWASLHNIAKPVESYAILPISTPIHVLPPELLSEIFIYALPAERFPSPSPSAAPLSLTHVCRHWRQVGLATPTLWSALHLNYRTAVEDVPPAHLWLSHSGDMPLSLSLSIDFDERPQQAIIDVFGRYSHRWKHVRFEFSGLQCPLMYNLNLAYENVPMLSSFQFSARGVSTLNIQPVANLLATAPNLNEIIWVDDLADTNTLLTLPLRQLSRLSLTMNNGRLDYLGVLNLCPNLEHIRISRPCPPEMQTPQIPLLLTKLTSLNIAHDLTNILDHLILPSLKRVRVHVDSDVPDHTSDRLSRALLGTPVASSNVKISWDPSSLISLVERSGCRIESLDIHAPIKEGDLVKCLRTCSDSLRSLTVSAKSVLGVDLIQLMVPRPALVASDEGQAIAWDCLCPSLTDLVLGAPLQSGTSVLEMVKSRLALSHSAQDLSLTSPSISNSIPSIVLPLKRLSLHYPAGHSDVAYLRELALLANSRHPSSLELSIVETRMGNIRGSSAARTRLFLHRSKFNSASR